MCLHIEGLEINVCCIGVYQKVQPTRLPKEKNDSPKFFRQVSLGLRSRSDTLFHVPIGCFGIQKITQNTLSKKFWNFGVLGLYVFHWGLHKEKIEIGPTLGPIKT